MNVYLYLCDFKCYFLCVKLPHHQLTMTVFFWECWHYFHTTVEATTNKWAISPCKFHSFVRTIPRRNSLSIWLNALAHTQLLQFLFIFSHYSFDHVLQQVAMPFFCVRFSIHFFFCVFLLACCRSKSKWI